MGAGEAPGGRRPGTPRVLAEERMAVVVTVAPLLYREGLRCQPVPSLRTPTALARRDRRMRKRAVCLPSQSVSNLGWSRRVLGT